FYDEVAEGDGQCRRKKADAPAPCEECRVPGHHGGYSTFFVHFVIDFKHDFPELGISRLGRRDDDRRVFSGLFPSVRVTGYRGRPVLPFPGHVPEGETRHGFAGILDLPKEFVGKRSAQAGGPGMEIVRIVGMIGNGEDLGAARIAAEALTEVVHRGGLGGRFTHGFSRSISLRMGRRNGGKTAYPSRIRQGYVFGEESARTAYASAERIAAVSLAPRSWGRNAGLEFGNIIPASGPPAPCRPPQAPECHAHAEPPDKMADYHEAVAGVCVAPGGAVQLEGRHNAHIAGGPYGQAEQGAGKAGKAATPPAGKKREQGAHGGAVSYMGCPDEPRLLVGVEMLAEAKPFGQPESAEPGRQGLEPFARLLSVDAQHGPGHGQGGDGAGY